MSVISKVYCFGVDSKEHSVSRLITRNQPSSMCLISRVKIYEKSDRI